MDTTRTPDWLAAKDIAFRLRLTASTIRLWGRQGRIPVLRLRYNVVRYDYSAVKSALEESENRRTHRD